MHELASLVYVIAGGAAIVLMLGAMALEAGHLRHRVEAERRNPYFEDLPDVIGAGWYLVALIATLLLFLGAAWLR